VAVDVDVDVDADGTAGVGTLSTVANLTSEFTLNRIIVLTSDLNFIRNVVKFRGSR